MKFTWKVIRFAYFLICSLFKRPRIKHNIYVQSTIAMTHVFDPFQESIIRNAKLSRELRVQHVKRKIEYIAWKENNMLLFGKAA